MISESSKHSIDQGASRDLQLWTAMALALVPILMATFSSYREGIPYFELGSLSVRSMPFIETSIFAISIYAFVRWFRKEDLLKSLAWVAIFLIAVILGVGYVELLKSPDGLQGYFWVAGVIFMNFSAAMTFGIAYRLAQRMMRRR